MSDHFPNTWVAFVSGNGLVVGIGRREPESLKYENAVALASLFSPITIIEWVDFVRQSPTPEKAADAIVAHIGGVRMNKPMDLGNVTLVFAGSTDAVAEA